jgi:hypothetical protein
MGVSSLDAVNFAVFLCPFGQLIRDGSLSNVKILQITEKDGRRWTVDSTSAPKASLVMRVSKSISAHPQTP